MKNSVKRDKVNLVLINALMQIIFVFYSIFFSIYVYNISGDINYVLGCNLFQIVCCFLIQIIITPVLDKRNSFILFRISFLLILCSILLVFTIDIDKMYMIFIVEFVYSFSLICYYVPYEIAIMNKNKASEVKGFLGVSTSVSMIAGVLAPFLSGYVIDYISYFWLILIISFLAIVCIILSFSIKNNFSDNSSNDIRDYIKRAFSIKSLKYSYISFGFYKLSQESAVSILLPVLLYMQVQTNFSVGLYSSLASFISAVVLLLYVKFINKRIITFIICSILVVGAAMALVAAPGIITFFVYFFIVKICGQILLNGVNENVFSVTKNLSLENYRKQHHLVFSSFNYIFQIVGFGLAFLVYNLFRNIYGITVMVLILNMLIFASLFFLIKSERYK